MSRGPIAVLSVRQANGGVRYLAIPRHEARAVRRDPATIDGVTVLACLDVERDGSAWWGRTGEDTTDGREAIRRHRRALAEVQS